MTVLIQNIKCKRIILYTNVGNGGSAYNDFGMPFHQGSRGIDRIFGVLMCRTVIKELGSFGCNDQQALFNCKGSNDLSKVIVMRDVVALRVDNAELWLIEDLTHLCL